MKEQRTTRYVGNTLELLVNQNIVATMTVGADGCKKLSDAFAAEFIANGYRGFATMAAAKKAVR